MTRRYNDDYYGVPIQEWEDKRIPAIVLHAHLTWIPTTAFFGWLAVGQFISNHDWRFWVGYGAGVYLMSMLFILLNETNENVRYVRHQLRAFRQAVVKTNDTIQKYHQPANATPDEILSQIDREWHP
jgi:hypothetical protein